MCLAHSQLPWPLIHEGRGFFLFHFRIDHYDGEQVTFHYNRHEDDSLVAETIPTLDFIKRLIIHVPEKHFKMVRYYGIYAKHHKQEKHLLI